MEGYVRTRLRGLRNQRRSLADVIEALAAGQLPITRHKNTSCIMEGGSLLLPVIMSKQAALLIKYNVAWERFWYKRF